MGEIVPFIFMFSSCDVFLCLFFIASDTQLITVLCSYSYDILNGVFYCSRRGFYSSGYLLSLKPSPPRLLQDARESGSRGVTRSLKNKHYLGK